MGGIEVRSPNYRPESFKVDPAERGSSGNVALIFPGQGSQFPGMGKEIYEASSAARALYEQASDRLGFSVPRLCFEGETEGHSLKKTGDAQVALAITMVANYRGAVQLSDEFAHMRPVAGGGISFGEFPNLHIAGVLDFDTYLDAIAERGVIMEEEGGRQQGKMIILIGVGYEDTETICSDNGVYPAIYYPEGVTVVAGLIDNIERVRSECERLKIKVKDTGVDYPFHTPLMQVAKERLIKAFSTRTFHDALYDVVINSTGVATRDGEVVREQIFEQITSPANVQRPFDTMYDGLAARTFVEVGPKPGLIKYVQRLKPNVRGISIHDFQSIRDFSLVTAAEPTPSVFRRAA